MQSLRALDAATAAGAFSPERLAALDTDERLLRRSNIALRYQHFKTEKAIREISDLIYNETLQVLAALSLKIADVASQSNACVNRSLDETQKLLSRIEEQLMNWVEQACPRGPVDLGPRAAIDGLCRRFSRTSNVKITADLEVFRSRVEVETVLYRAVREALFNVEQHAQATHVSVRIHERNSIICCTVQDDGIGFDVQAILSQMERRGSGLGAVAESLRPIGGRLSIHSAPHHGTELEIIINR